MLKNVFNQLNKMQKIVFFSLLSSLILLSIFAMPSLARYKNRSSLLTAIEWDGTVANSYRSGSGSENDPYIISSAKEFAYFKEQLLTNNYENAFFKLEKDIILNKGLFSYDISKGINYIVENKTYTIDEYTSEYYITENNIKTVVNHVNLFTPLDNFKGTFNGDSHTIYGLYMTSNEASELSLFTNLTGNISDLYVSNGLIYGGGTTSGIASNITSSTIRNVVFDGNIVNTTSNNKTAKSSLDSITRNVSGTINENIALNNNVPSYVTEIISTTLTGKYTSDKNSSIIINGESINSGDFSLSLGSNILSSLPITINSNENATIKLDNLSYNVIYKYGIASGIIGISHNSTLKNIINKANVYGDDLSAGLVGIASNSLVLENSYNIGNTNSLSISGGLVGLLANNDGNVSILRSYNTGTISSIDMGGIVGKIVDSNVSININGVFDVEEDNYAIGAISDSTVDISNSYYVSNSNSIKSGFTDESFVKTTIENLKNSEFLTENLLYNAYVSQEDLLIYNTNVWVFLNASFPSLYIDDTVGGLDIRTSIGVWNNLSYNLNTLPLNLKITFDIAPSNELFEFKDIYYYVYNSNVPFTKTQLDELNPSLWKKYTLNTIIDITEEGSYIIYAKGISHDGKITYVNSDILALDLISININEYSWSSSKTNLDFAYLNKKENVTINYDKSLIGIKSIKYYIANSVLTTIELSNISDISWITYEDFSLNDSGTYVIYVKTVDLNDNVIYINSDYIVLGGYIQNNLIIGRNHDSYSSNISSITNKSSITLNYVYETVHPYSGIYTHNLISSILLPTGTKIILFDNITNKIYEYIIPDNVDHYNYNNSCESVDCNKKATYPLTLFNEYGNVNNVKYVDNSYLNDGIIKEDFTVVLDFSNNTSTSNYENVSLYMQLNNSVNDSAISTLESSIKKFNIYADVNNVSSNANIYLETGTVFNSSFNNVSITNIPINTGISYASINNKSIIDTSYEDKNIGLVLKIVDSNGNIVPKSDLTNLTVRFDGNNYYPSNNNYVYVHLTNGLNDISGTLSVIMYQDNNILNGDYNIILTNYLYYDGLFINDYISNEKTIPLNLTGITRKIKYKFDVNEINNSYIINKSDNKSEMDYKILLNGNFKNPSVRISLYKKLLSTAYNQNYVLVDMSDYFSNNMPLISNKTYLVNENNYSNFSLNAITNSFERNGYKLVFELYDDDVKITNIDKYFIAK